MTLDDHDTRPFTPGIEAGQTATDDWHTLSEEDRLQVFQSLPRGGNLTR